MNGKQYWKNQIPFFLINILCMAGLFLFLFLNGNSVDILFFIGLVWLLIFISYQTFFYYYRKKQTEALLHMTENLEERYLIAELIKKPRRADDQVFYQILKMCNKSMLEHIDEILWERKEYKEYIEQWIHEIKTPITAIKLLCENHRFPFTKELLIELEKINCFTEQALYYARSEHTEKDYSIREINIYHVIHESIADNKYFLLQNGVKIELEEDSSMVYCDDKWLRFILNQIIINAVKYRTKHPIIKFSTYQEREYFILSIEDNGIGICSADLPRIFEKGFTGQNGRDKKNATGIGLYLCKKLCDKLDIGIYAQSGDKGTTILLKFYINDFIYEIQE